MNRAIILAGGNSERFGRNKLSALLWGESVLSSSLATFSAHPEVAEIILVISAKNATVAKKLSHDFPKIKKIVTGGKTRFASAQAGFYATKMKNTDLVIFHNAANPAVTAEEISAVLKAAAKNGAAGVGRKISATIRHQQKTISRTLPREGIFLMETPQALTAEIFMEGLAAWSNKNPPTDDLELAEILGIPPEILPAHPHNRKITLPADLLFLEQLKTPELRIGSGEDSHAFEKIRKKCRIGGVEIPEAPGFIANSDGDVALHALCNALLSAIGENSFSAIADPLCAKGVGDSAVYLKKVTEKLKKKNAVIVNAVCVFEGKKPKLEKHFPKIRQNLSKLLQISPDAIGLNANSGEGLSAYGRGEGLRCAATVLLKIYTS